MMNKSKVYNIVCLDTGSMFNLAKVFACARKSEVLIIQVNKKIYKLERVYRDCIKMTRDKTRIYSILHDAPGT